VRGEPAQSLDAVEMESFVQNQREISPTPGSGGERVSRRGKKGGRELTAALTPEGGGGEREGTRQNPEGKNSNRFSRKPQQLIIMKIRDRREKKGGRNVRESRHEGRR